MKVLLLGRISEARHALHHMMAARGHVVSLTDDHAAFWTAFVRDSFPLVLLDRSISGYPYLDLCRRMRAISPAKQPLLVLYGLRGQDVHGDLLVDATVDEYLSINDENQEDLDTRIIMLERRALQTVIQQHTAAETQTVLERIFYHLENSPLAVVEWDQNLRIRHWSQGAEQLFGWKANDVNDKSVMDWPFIRQQDSQDVFRSVSMLVDGPDIQASRVSHNITSDGHAITIEWRTSLLRGASGQFISAVSIAVDVTAREQMLETLQFGEQRFRSLVHNSPELILTIDLDGTIGYASPSVERTLAHDTAAITGGSLFDIIHPDDRERARGIVLTLREGAGTSAPRAEFRFQHKEGGWRDIEVVATNLINDPSVGEIVIVGRDVSGRKQLEQELTQQAFYDSLTGLPNRALFLNRLAHALNRVERSHHSIAVLFLDLDRFKHINDSLGHSVGDQLLAAFARSLQEQVRQGDTVARLGGDEFTLLLEDITNPQEAAMVARRILNTLQNPIAVANHEVFVMASIGITFADNSTRTPDDVINNADAALYRAKETGRGRYVVFDENLAGETIERLALAADLRQALGSAQLVLHFQPEVDLRTGEITGFETLVRWQHPRLGLLYPAAFLDLACEDGLIVPIGQWILGEACRTAVTWEALSPQAHLPSVSVNLTSREFRQPELIFVVRSALAASGLAPERLKLEVAESTVTESDSTTLARLNELSDLGVRVVIDNFGAGISSLAVLAQLAAETIKIDRAFISGKNSLTDNLSIVRAMTSLAHAFGMDVVAEGIETQEQKDRVTAAGCNRGQGNALFAPMEADAVQALLHQPLSS